MLAALMVLAVAIVTLASSRLAARGVRPRRFSTPLRLAASLALAALPSLWAVVTVVLAGTPDFVAIPVFGQTDEWTRASAPPTTLWSPMRCDYFDTTDEGVPGARRDWWTREIRCQPTIFHALSTVSEAGESSVSIGDWVCVMGSHRRGGWTRHLQISETSYGRWRRFACVTAGCDDGAPSAYCSASPPAFEMRMERRPLGPGRALPLAAALLSLSTVFALGTLWWLRRVGRRAVSQLGSRERSSRVTDAPDAATWHGLPAAPFRAARLVPPAERPHDAMRRRAVERAMRRRWWAVVLAFSVALGASVAVVVQSAWRPHGSMIVAR